MNHTEIVDTWCLIKICAKIRKDIAIMGPCFGHPSNGRRITMLTFLNIKKLMMKDVCH